MLFSIITPVYNTEKYVSRCIESVVYQSFAEFELILVDDGSTDCSGHICDVYAQNDPRIHVIHQKNQGQGCARNKAIEIAKGNYLVFVDSDDWIAKGLLEYLETVIRKYQPEIIIYGKKILNERNARKNLYNSKSDINEEILGRKELWHRYFAGKFGGEIGGKCISKKLIKNDIKFPEVHAREDAYLIDVLLSIIESAVITNYLGYYQLFRYGSTEQSRVTNDLIVTTLKVVDNRLKYIQNELPDLYELAFRANIQERILCLQCIYADGKSYEFSNEINKIKDNLSSKFDKIRTSEICNQEYKLVDIILHKPLLFKILNLKLKMYRTFNRIKRFIYAKIY